MSKQATSHIRAAVIQMVSSTNVAENMHHAEQWIARAAKENAQWVVLPEYWPIMGQHAQDKLAVAEKMGEGSLQAALSQWAKQYHITLFSGSIPLISTEKNKVFNTMLTFNPQGECIARYDKTHLFGFSGLGEVYRESDTMVAGKSLPQLHINGWHIAQGICFDLRFPEFFRAQGKHDVLILPAAFTHTTGQAHWEILLRARAIENQCYVLASAQGGLHQNGRQTFGNSMIIDPWGKIIACHTEGEGVIFGELALSNIASLRKKLPMDHHQISIELDTVENGNIHQSL